MSCFDMAKELDGEYAGQPRVCSRCEDDGVVGVDLFTVQRVSGPLGVVSEFWLHHDCIIPYSRDAHSAEAF